MSDNVSRSGIEYVERNKEQPLFDSAGKSPVYDHALVVTVFSAVAVESAISEFILKRLYDTPEQYRSLLIRLCHDRRVYFDERLKTIDELEPGLNLEKNKELRKLNSDCNKIKHYRGEYWDREKPSIYPETRKIAEKAKKGISYQGPSLAQIESAFGHYKTAGEILELLAMHLRGHILHLS